MVEKTETLARPETRVVKLADLHPAPYNPRADLQPGDPDFETIRTSIETYGLVDDLVWNEATGNLVGGHQRLKVLRSLGVEEIAVKVVNLSPGLERSLNVMLNKAVGRWDNERLVALHDELGSLEDSGPTGFSGDEIDGIRFGLEQPDDASWDDALVKTNSTPEGRSFRQLTLTLSVAQAEDVENAIARARGELGDVDTGNENGRGNALHHAIRGYLDE